MFTVAERASHDNSPAGWQTRHRQDRRHAARRMLSFRAEVIVVAHFFPSGFPEDTSCYLVDNRQVRRVTLAVGTRPRVGLWGQGPANEALAVAPKDSSLAQIAELPGPWAVNTRMFQLSGIKAGNTVIEAKTLAGLNWATADLVVLPQTRRGAGPRRGKNGEIPSKYQSALTRAIDMAWKLDANPKFVEVFRSTVNKLAGSQSGPELYSSTLNKMVIHLAETSKDPRIVKELKEDAEARRTDKEYQSAPAYSFRYGTDIWIREFSLAKGEKAIAANIIHEAAHLAGAPSDLLAEIAIDAIHNEAGLPR